MHTHDDTSKIQISPILDREGLDLKSADNIDTALRNNMSVTAEEVPSTAAAQPMRQNGKNWHGKRKAFRPSAGQTSYEKRAAKTKELAITKAHERELKDEKEAERQSRIQAIKERRAAKEERERYEKMAEKMHKKRVERLKRREKRNKMLKS